MQAFEKRSFRKSKIVPIKKLVQNVQDGDTIHFTAINGGPSQVIHALVREFCGKKIKINVSMAGLINISLTLLHCDIIDKIITTFVGEGYPTPGPSPIVQKKFQEGKLKVENWSMLTLPLRLLAGAYNWEWIPTHSLRGSTLFEDLEKEGLAKTISVGGREITLIKKYQPDWIFVHAIASDEEGNLLMPAPRGEDPKIVFAAKKGILSTVDYLVSREFVRNYPGFVGVPADRVKEVAVCHFGSHPGGVINMGLPLQAYAEDYDFMYDFRKASADEEELEKWMKYWTFDVHSCEEYKKKLGSERVMMLMGKSYPMSWKEDLIKYSDTVEGEINYIERMTLIAGKIVAERIKEKGYKNVLAGIGISGLASWMAKKFLQEEGKDVNLVAELGQYDYEPRPTNPFIFNFWNSWSSTLAAGIFEGLAIFTQGFQANSLGVLGAGQVDKYGNVNSTIIPGVMYLVGSGGANDVASGADEVIVVMEHQPGRLVDKVPYITAPGNRVTMLITSLGVFEKENGQLILKGVIIKEGENEREIVEKIKKMTLWDVKIAPSLKHYDFEDEKWLKILRLYDPRRQFIGTEK